MSDHPPIVRKLTHEEARAEQRLYWSRKSIPERITAAAALTRQANLLRGIVSDDQSPDFTPRRIPREKR